MAKLPQGTTEFLRVDVTDKTGQLNSIVGTNPTYDVRDEQGTWLYDNELAVAIDEVDDEHGRYRAYGRPVGRWRVQAVHRLHDDA